MVQTPAFAATPAHDWLRPRVAALVNEAERAGIPRDIAVAVIIDLAGAPPFDQASTPEPQPEPAPQDAIAADPLAVELDVARLHETEQPEPTDIPAIAKSDL